MYTLIVHITSKDNKVNPITLKDVKAAIMSLDTVCANMDRINEQIKLKFSKYVSDISTENGIYILYFNHLIELTGVNEQREYIKPLKYNDEKNAYLFANIGLALITVIFIILVLK